MATRVLDQSEIQRALSRIAHEILEREKGADNLVLMGIPSRGVPLAQRIAERIRTIEPGAEVPVGALDVTMFRDDLRLRPARALGHTVVPPEGIDGRTVVLVDDVVLGQQETPFASLVAHEFDNRLGTTTRTAHTTGSLLHTAVSDAQLRQTINLMCHTQAWNTSGTVGASCGISD